jgi:hypothetical protein
VSKYHFGRLKIKQWVAGLDLGHLKLFFHLRKGIKKYQNKLTGFLQEITKKNTSDAWSMRQLTQ